MLATAQSPVLRGNPYGSTPFYDAQLNRWLPVAPEQISPDGTAYAYATNTPTIQVVSVADGTTTSITVKTPSDTATGIVVEGFDGRNAYFSLGSIEGHPTGMWKIDVTSGAVTALVQVTDVFAVREGSAWVGYLDPHDTNPPVLPSGGEGQLFDSIVQINLTTGARTTWFYRPGQSVSLLAIDDSGRPVVMAKTGPDNFSAGGEIRRIDEPLSGGENGGELVYSGGMSFEPPQADGDRLWFGSDRGIYVYTSASGFLKVFAFGGDPAARHEYLLPAGACR